MKALLKAIPISGVFLYMSLSLLSVFRFLIAFLLVGFLAYFHLSFLAEAKTRPSILAQQTKQEHTKSEIVFRPEDQNQQKSKRFQNHQLKDQRRGERIRNLAQVEKKEERKARGLVIRFHRWPSLKQRKEVERLLKASSLKRTKSIKSFKAQLFEWNEGGLKASKEAERVCLKLKSLSYVRRCSPDHLLSVNSVKSPARVVSLLGLRANTGNVYRSKIWSFKKISKNSNRIGINESEIFSKTIPIVLKNSGFYGRENSQKLKQDRYNNEFFIAEAGKRSETEAGFSFECRDCKNQGIKPIAEALDKTLDIRTCNLISDKQELMGGTLSDYWAQELIGSDLLREELKKTPAPDRENWIAVFDTEQGNHNIAVKNLISDEGLHAVLPELGGEKTPFLETKSKPQDRESYKKGEGGYNKALSLYETSYPGDYLFGFKNRAPHYINNSMAWRESQDIYEIFERLSSSTSNTVVVLSSGNGFPSKLEDIKSKASKNYDVVLVGSFSPRGFVSEFSQAGEELSILVPSDDWITSAEEDGSYSKFRGTSGATPLVTGSLAGFEWLSGYHPTAKEAKILLEKTALPTLHSFEQPRINGAGLLNAYRLGEVAKRLKEKCGDKALSCFKEEILKDELYRFPKDKSLRRDMARVFPGCSGDKLEDLTSLPDCKEKGELFKRLRKSVLLSPSKELLGSLSCLYKSAGFYQNAEGIERLAMSLGSESEVRSRVRAMVLKEKARGNLSKDTVRLMLGMGGFEEEFKLFKNKDALRIAVGMGERGLPLLEKGFDSGERGLQEMALRLAGYIGERGLPLLEKGFASGKRDLQKEALLSAGNIGERGLPLLEKGFASGKRDLQSVALYSVGRLGERGLPLLEKGFASGERGLQEMALRLAGYIGERGLPLLEKGFASGKRDLQKEALLSAGNIGERGLPLLEKGFASGKRDLQSVALYSVGRLGERGLPLLEKGFASGELDLQKEALRLVGNIGERGLPLLEKGFDSGELDLQKEALWLAGEIGERGLPLLEKGFDSGELDLQKEVLSSVGNIGERGLPLLEKGFDSGELDLQIRALYSAGNIGERGLPLLEKGFGSGELDLQKTALSSVFYMGETAIPLLKRVLKNKDLDENIRREIEDWCKLVRCSFQ